MRHVCPALGGHLLPPPPRRVHIPESRSSPSSGSQQGRKRCSGTAGPRTRGSGVGAARGSAPRPAAGRSWGARGAAVRARRAAMGVPAPRGLRTARARRGSYLPISSYSWYSSVKRVQVTVVAMAVAIGLGVRSAALGRRRLRLPLAGTAATRARARETPRLAAPGGGRAGLRRAASAREICSLCPRQERAAHLRAQRRGRRYRRRARPARRPLHAPHSHPTHACTRIHTAPAPYTCSSARACTRTAPAPRLPSHTRRARAGTRTAPAPYNPTRARALSQHMGCSTRCPRTASAPLGPRPARTSHWAGSSTAAVEQ